MDWCEEHHLHIAKLKELCNIPDQLKTTVLLPYMAMTLDRSFLSNISLIVSLAGTHMLQGSLENPSAPPFPSEFLVSTEILCTIFIELPFYILVIPPSLETV